VTKNDNAVRVQWLGDLRRCGITDEEFGFVRGKYSAIGIGETFGVRASIAAGYIAKLDGTVDFGKAGGAIIQIEDSGGDAVDSACRRFGWPSRVLRSACLKCATIFWPKRMFISLARRFASAKPFTTLSIRTGPSSRLRVLHSGGRAQVLRTC
jgi:hypothetical protein